MRFTYQELAHFWLDKCYQYAKVYFFWYSMCQDFVDFYHRWHLCHVNKIPTQVPEGKPRPILIPKSWFESHALGFGDPLPSNQKYDLFLVVLDCFIGNTYLFPVSKNINARQTAQILLDKIFTTQEYSLTIVSDRDSQFTSDYWYQLMKNLQIKLKMATSYHHQTDSQTECTICMIY
jgi:hypothetical protein